MPRRWGLILTILVLLLLLGIACFVICSKEQTPMPEGEASEQLSAWYVYWDNAPVKSIPEKITSIILFGCIYDDAGELVIPEQLRELASNVDPDYSGKVYLSYINDVSHADGKVTQKSPALLEKLFTDQQSMEHTIDEMIRQASEWNCDGIELDFENMKKNTALWEPYFRFVGLLHGRTEEAGLELRVVLEPRAPVDSFTVPEGPEYVVMCYNLYGGHSGPGPKADIAFLRETAERFRGLTSLQGAFATGGFIWDADGKMVSSLKQHEAEALCLAYDQVLQRDPKSGALFFSYPTEDGEHTVWYADEETLILWMETFNSSLEQKTGASIWRTESDEDKQTGTRLESLVNRIYGQ